MRAAPCTTRRRSLRRDAMEVMQVLVVDLSQEEVEQMETKIADKTLLPQAATKPDRTKVVSHARAGHEGIQAVWVGESKRVDFTGLFQDNQLGAVAGHGGPSSLPLEELRHDRLVLLALYLGGIKHDNVRLATLNHPAARHSTKAVLEAAMAIRDIPDITTARKRWLLP